jgi:protein O-GlcNAc transferase
MGFLSKLFHRHKEKKFENEVVPVVPVELADEFSSYESLRSQGAALLDLGDFDAALVKFEGAFQASPNAESHLNLSYALLEVGRRSEARTLLEHAAALDPGNFDTQMLRASASLADGDHETAKIAIGCALAIDPESQVAVKLFYELLVLEGEFQEIENHLIQRYQDTKSASELKVAMACSVLSIPLDGDARPALLVQAEGYLKAAIELDPVSPVPVVELGKLYLAQNKPTAALQCFENAVVMEAPIAASNYALAIAYSSMGKNELATTSAKKAVSLDPTHIESYQLLAEISLQNADPLAAEAHYNKILEIDPDTPDALLMLGVLYGKRRENQLAIDVSRRAVSLRKSSPEAYFALGNTLANQQLFTEAVACYRRALKLRPGYFDVRNNLASALLAMGSNKEALELYQAIVRDDPMHAIGLQNIAFCLTFDAAFTTSEYLAIARQFGAVAAKNAKPFTSWHQKPLNDRPLRVGLVSGDFCLHPVGSFLESVLTYFDIEKTEVHAFSNRTMLDPMQASLKSRVSQWTSIEGVPDEAAAKLIHDAELDLLIDLAGHTGAGRCALFAWRPAPVQATWLGYWASTGVAEIDYVLSDRHSVLPEHQAQFSEQVWYLADTRLCFTPPNALYELLPAPCPALKRGYITFGCFQSIRKLNKSVLAVWSRIHQELPSARFRLQGGGFTDPEVNAELVKRLSDAGLPPECFSLHGGQLNLDYLKTHREVDIILDTFPFPGGTTTCEALWMGVPTVTLAGNTMLSRQGASLLSFAGLTDWIAQTEDEYVAIALQKAGDLKHLSRLRAALRQQVFTSPLFNAPEFSRHLEDTFREMVLNKRPELMQSQKVANP